MAENNTDIFSDDPDAIAKLTEKLERLQKRQEYMKAVNAYFKKNGTRMKNTPLWGWTARTTCSSRSLAAPASGSTGKCG